MTKEDLDKANNAYQLIQVLREHAEVVSGLNDKAFVCITMNGWKWELKREFVNVDDIIDVYLARVNREIERLTAEFDAIGMVSERENEQ